VANLILVSTLILILTFIFNHEARESVFKGWYTVLTTAPGSVLEKPVPHGHMKLASLNAAFLFSCSSCGR
jgi:hypothetical protein